LVIQNWYLGSQYHVEEFRFTDSTVLLDSQVQSLVTAMATFDAASSSMWSDTDVQRARNHAITGTLVMPALV
jgi:hypothetical protein